MFGISRNGATCISHEFMLEQQYTSTTAKLLCHPDRFKEWRKGKYQPITLQLAPTDKCNLKCSFCSVAQRKGDELAFQDIKQAIYDLKEHGLKAVELTGGGDPTMYPQINYLLMWLLSLGLKVGMITNGVSIMGKVAQTTLDQLQWLRISLNSLDYIPTLVIPNIMGTLGFSYVINDKSTGDTARRIKALIDKHHPAYVRIVPNCLSMESIIQCLEIAKKTGLSDLDRTFLQAKKYHVPKNCHIGYLKPFLAPDGYFYHCSANPLLERKFHPKFRMGHWDEVNKIWGGDFASADVTQCQEGKCFFKEHNDFLALLRLQVPHPDFL